METNGEDISLTDEVALDHHHLHCCSGRGVLAAAQNAHGECGELIGLIARGSEGPYMFADDPYETTYVTYDERRVSRELIDRVIDAGAAVYRSYDERAVTHEVILRALARTDGSHSWLSKSSEGVRRIGEDAEEDLGGIEAAETRGGDDGGETHAAATASG